MNPRQLESRLLKITDSQKLENFLFMARQTGNAHLAQMASNRQEALRQAELMRGGRRRELQQQRTMFTQQPPKESRDMWRELAESKTKIENPPERLFWNGPIRVIRFDGKR